MDKVKVICTILTLVGIAGLTVAGSSGTDIGMLIPVGVGVGSAVSALIAILKKKRVEK